MTQNIAVLGCGGWGTNVVRSVAAIGALAAVSDPNAALARKHADQYGVRSLSLEEVLADPAIEGVMIAAPAHLHYDLAVRVIEAGKDVYVEKPLTLTTGDGRKLVALAQERGRLLMVGHLLQYHPAFIRLKELAAAGEFGRIVNIYSHRLNMGKIRREEDVLWSFAPHDISMILALAGESPTRVTSFKMPTLHPTISDTTISHFEFASGLKAHVHVSWLNPLKEQRLVVVGDKAMAVFDDRQKLDQKLAIYRHRVAWTGGVPRAVAVEPEYVPIPDEQPLINECQHFLDCIRSRATPRTDGREGLAVLAVLEQASPLDAGAAARTTASLPPGAFVHETAIVDDGVELGAGVKIWHFSHVLPGSVIGEKTSVGQNVVIGPDVKVGARCKIQNNVSLYKGVELADGVFCGPSCVFTNVVTPRAEYERKNEFAATPVGRGASIGANATIVCGHSIGAFALIAAGAVVTRDVRPHALMAGVPARQIGWVSHAGRRLGDDLVCPEERRHYRVNPGGDLEEIPPLRTQA
jgi:UDP-2-acetamido-3-amino-2,3-dideoxy-glucuronate N-acetyltransferase